ncbi:Anti-sigma-K factor rskA [Nocardioides exalbidus]|uniref:Anti-sigma-K factor rskA n=1 Tax=Nocardioides exalbidus TaxID=402596 RepID=A0A1H4SDN6_9ACTN|nr:anti-sigma factor [Nocardioides exalbidus]SEC42239.1 Anti-sigma-K factor rskA [Nocardioides exalbidus]
MTHPQPDELAGLVVDPSDADPAVLEHVSGCDECAGLVDRLAGVRSSAAESEALVAPPEGVRHRVLAEIAGSSARVVPLVPPPSRRRALPAWVVGLAAAVALVAGLGLGRLTVGDPDPVPDRRDPATVVAAADLTALDSEQSRGVAEVVRDADAVTLRVKARDLGQEEGFHEVWLINLDGVRMVALGVLGDGEAGDFRVPGDLVDEGYRIVDISIEPDDGDPTHSGVSLARGELA